MNGLRNSGIPLGGLGKNISVRSAVAHMMADEPEQEGVQTAQCVGCQRRIEPRLNQWVRCRDYVRETLFRCPWTVSLVPWRKTDGYRVLFPLDPTHRFSSPRLMRCEAPG